MKRYKRMALKLLLMSLAAPGVCLALTNGPAMPEYNDFEPVDATDMVNLTNGTFAYTIPLMTVPGPGLGFPLVLSYHSGITPKQEASWVGLGWNLQAGAITRQVNKVPDDYKGDVIVETVKSDKIHGWMASIGYNAITVGVSWDNTHGYGGMVGLGVTIPGTPLSVGFTSGWNGVYSGVGVTSGMGMGLTEATGAGLSIGAHSRKGATVGLGVSSGPFNVGVEASSVGPSVSAGISLGAAQVSLSSRGGVSAGSTLGGMSQEMSVNGNQHSQQFGAFLAIPTPVGVFSASWGTYASWISGIGQDQYYGFLYSDKAGMGCVQQDGQPNCMGWRNITSNSNGEVDRGQYPYKKQELEDFGEDWLGYGSHDHGRLMGTAEDVYSVATQGISGVFKPYRKEDGDYITTLHRFSQASDIENCGFFSFLGCPGTDYNLVNRPKLLEEGRNYLNSLEAQSDVYWRFVTEAAGAEYTDPYLSRDVPGLVSHQATKIIPHFRGNRLVGFEIIKGDGVKYVYGLAVQASKEFKAGVLKDNVNYLTTQTMNGAYAYAWLLTSIQSIDYARFGSGHACQNTDKGISLCEPKEGDLGGWVKFTYSSSSPDEPGTFHYTRWMTPYVDEKRMETTNAAPNWNTVTSAGSNKTRVQYGPSSMGQVNKDGAAFHTSRSLAKGEKEVTYLSTVETPTHRAEFTLGSREDARSDETNIFVLIPQEDILSSENHDCTDNPQQVFQATAHYMSCQRTVTVKTRAMVGQTVKVKVGYQYWYINTNSSFDHILKQPILTASGPVVRSGKFNTVTFTIPDQALSGWLSSMPDNPVLAPQATEPCSLLIETPLAPGLKRLEYIRLWNKVLDQEVAAVNFGYNYLLSPQTPNGNPAQNQGKLTLTQVKTGASINDGPWLAPYEFLYREPGAVFQKPYSTHAWVPFENHEWDRWGFRCTTCSDAKHEPNGTDALAWNLEKIKLPSYAWLEVDYESNSFRYVGKEEYYKPITGSPTRREVLIHRNYRPKGSTVVPVNFNPTNLPDYRVFTQRGYRVKFRVERIENTGIPAAQTCPAGAITTTSCNALPVEMLYPDGTRQAVVAGQSYAKTWTASGFTSFDLKVGARCLSPTQVCPQEADLVNYEVSGEIDQPANLNVNGGGVRVKAIRQKDYYSDKVNTVNYTYEEGATPALPPSFSDYDDARLPPNLGYEAYQGSPSIMYGKVTTSFQPAGYKSVNYFITPRHLPTVFGNMDVRPGTPTPGTEPAWLNVNNRITIADLSAMWGLQWKKQDFRGLETTPIRTETKKWAANGDWLATYNTIPAAETPFQIQYVAGQGNTINVEAESVIEEFPTYNGHKSIFADNDDKKDRFGLHFSVFGHRYYYGVCTGAQANESSCQAGFIRSTRLFLQRILPLLAETRLTQDGLSSGTRYYHYDFLSGEALKSWKRNSDGAVEVSAKVPAHANYPAMASRNQLTQEYSSSKYFYPVVGGVQKTVVPGESENPANVVSAAYSAWRPYGSPWHHDGVYRIWSEFAFRSEQPLGSITSFGEPNDRCLPSATQLTSTTWSQCFTNTLFPASWIRQQEFTKYDFFGHPVEFKNADNVPHALRYGYGNSMVTAYAQNADLSALFHESFEVPMEYEPKIQLVDGQKRIVEGIAKSGKSSLGLYRIAGWWISNVCMNVGTLNAGVKYTASAWYLDHALPHASKTDFPIPGISLGKPGGCYQEMQVYTDATGPITAVNPQFQATGSGQWKRIEVSVTCPSEQLDAKVCLYHNKDSDGSNTSTTNVGTTIYDEVRVRPEASLMKTFTYDAKGNMTSFVDPRETVTRFEYDIFGNLVRTRDDDGRVTVEKAKQVTRK